MQKLQNRGSITLKDVCENTSEVRCENETLLSLKMIWRTKLTRWPDEIMADSLPPVVKLQTLE